MESTMVKQLEMRVIGEEVNAAVVQHPGRRFPGILIQGDSLSILCSHARQLTIDLAEARLEDAAESATELRELLDGYRAAYERAMDAEGLALPYSRRG